MKMNGKALAAAVLLLVLAGTTESAGAVTGTDDPAVGGGTELWSAQEEACSIDGPEQLQSMAVPVSEVQCINGGLGSVSCEIRCNRMLGFYYSTCRVDCGKEYYSCCNCNDGATCHCYLDHSELWPIAPRD